MSIRTPNTMIIYNVLGNFYNLNIVLFVSAVRQNTWANTASTTIHATRSRAPGVRMGVRATFECLLMDLLVLRVVVRWVLVHLCAKFLLRTHAIDVHV